MFGVFFEVYELEHKSRKICDIWVNAQIKENLWTWVSVQIKENL